MLPLKDTPREAVPEAVELSEGNDKNRQIAGVVLDSQVRNVAPGGQASIHRALAILRADLKVVEEAIQALELIAPEGSAEPSCGPSMPMPVTAPMRKPKKVVDIHTKRA